MQITSYRFTVLFAFLALPMCPIRAMAKPPTTAPATTRSATVASVGEAERVYKSKLDSAKLQYQQSITAARQERVRQLKSLEDKAMTAKDMDRALQLRNLITAAEAEIQSNALPTDLVAEKQRPPVALHIVGKVDGRAVLTVRQDDASWHQVELDAPESVTLNGVALYPGRSDSLHNTGPTKFLPTPVNLRTGALVKKTARNMVEVQATDDELRIAFNDTDPGAGRYDLTIEFQPLSAPPAKK